ncbi:alpha-galactosidase [Lacticaseibacillus rhamnosus]|uniref:Alpha-galactosidase n=1 Tax=Lacticaseibacillus rhamnosus TaxID=47715 RepID=A0AAX0K117_LACRH|nr:alpha-galactosidase [Lacticaseibacillus rhamnosus]PCL28230.1 alpha-galactosidase [Lacticaseibacillus rhamnosus]PCL36088.1 alpha-galactosidase [Lacticaseibacillus rhamnosus]PCL38905.1 alpha-galactosidase [Lacticaseibacillus rhamnosus]PCL41869.1 alpha-galactosidase [Lacticaseibacillus rhamnosus]
MEQPRDRAKSHSLSITRSPAQGSACKDLGRNGQRPTITVKAAYVLAHAHNAFAGAGICV